MSWNTDIISAISGRVGRLNKRRSLINLTPVLRHWCWDLPDSSGLQTRGSQCWLSIKEALVRISPYYVQRKGEISALRLKRDKADEISARCGRHVLY